MSGEDEGRQPPQHPYWTRLRRSFGQGGESSSAIEEEEGGNQPTPESQYGTSSSDTEDLEQVPDEVPDLDLQRFVGALAVNQVFRPRRLQFTESTPPLPFDPLRQGNPVQTPAPIPINQPFPPPAVMAQPVPNPRVGAAKFSGKPKEDADSHVGQFETRWMASGYNVIHNDVTKKEHFAATLQGKAMAWFMQYGIAILQNMMH